MIGAVFAGIYYLDTAGERYQFKTMAESTDFLVFDTWEGKLYVISGVTHMVIDALNGEMRADDAKLSGKFAEK